MPGFPDWQQFAQHTGPTTKYSITTVNGAVTVFTIPVAEWAGIELDIAPPTTAETRLDFNWRPSTTSPDAVRDETWDLWRLTQASLRVPMSAAALRLLYFCGTAGLSATIYATPTNSVLPVERAPLSAALSEGSVVSIGAGATQTFNLLAYRGPAYFYYRTQAATSTVLLASFDYNGVQTGELYRQLNVGQNQQILHLPSECNQLSLSNNDAAAKNFSWTITAIQ